MQADFEEIMAKKEVSYDEIRQLSSQRLEKYDGKSLIEKYALYMGMVQILELQMKQIIYSQFDYESEGKLEKLEKMTLGGAVKILEEKLKNKKTKNDKHNNSTQS